MISATEIKEFGRRIGLDLVRITSADPFPAYPETVQNRLENKLIPAESRASEDIFKRAQFYSNPQNSLFGAKSIISIGIGYFISGHTDNTRRGHPCGVIGRHYWRDFYGELWRRRAGLSRFLEAKGIQCSKEAYLPYKLAAQRAGVGWYGKNGLIQTEAYGSWVVLTAIVTSADVDIDEPVSADCGTCQVCIKACPTQAIVAPYVVNVARCINHLTATSGSIPRELRSAIGHRINGCDRCQEVCPNNLHAQSVRETFPNPRPQWGTSPALVLLLDISEQEFGRSFTKLDWYEPKLQHLQRNILVALGNIGNSNALPVLDRMLSHPEGLIRSYAAWALGKIGGGNARQALVNAYQAERETEVRKEIETALGIS